MSIRVELFNVEFGMWYPVRIEVTTHYERSTRVVSLTIARRREGCVLANRKEEAALKIEMLHFKV